MIGRNDWYRLQRCLEIGLQQKEDAAQSLLATATSSATSTGDSVIVGAGNLKRGREEEGEGAQQVLEGVKEGGNEGVEVEAESASVSTLTGTILFKLSH